MSNAPEHTPELCGVATICGPDQVKILCGHNRKHTGPHSWAELPCLRHVAVQLGTITVNLAELAEACNRPPCPVEKDETH